MIRLATARPAPRPSGHQLLLVPMIVEVMYTVQVSFREHVLAPQPFVLVALSRRGTRTVAERA